MTGTKNKLVLALRQGLDVFSSRGSPDDEQRSQRKRLTEAKQSASVPQHIVLFPDGNRRWAKKQGVSAFDGHSKGREIFADFMTWCKDRGVLIVTVFGFSTENWNRSKEEVAYLMNLFEVYLGSDEQIATYMKEGMRVRVIGDRSRLSSSLLVAIDKAETMTANNTEFTMNLAVSYGGRWDITNAVKEIVAEGITADKITEDVISEHLSMAELPDPDLIIRVGGEKRLSNFVLWQGAYSELYFSPKYWPDFNEQDLDAALAEYAQRQRRFGK